MVAGGNVAAGDVLLETVAGENVGGGAVANGALVVGGAVGRESFAGVAFGVEPASAPRAGVVVVAESPKVGGAAWSATEAVITDPSTPAR